MPFPELSWSPDSPLTTEADALVIALPPLEAAGDLDADWPGLSQSLEAVGFTGAPCSVVRTFVPALCATPLIVVGTGAEPDADALREAVGAAVRVSTGKSTLAVVVPGSTADDARAIAEGAVLGGYQFAGYRSIAAPARAERIILHSAESAEQAIAEARVVGSAAALVKDLVETPAQWLGPQDFAEKTIEAVAGLPVDVDVYDEQRMAEEGFGGILGVGQGSDRPPRFVRLDYSPAGAERHIALVGKGITFDTGGLSLKPPASMVGMKFDMCGAATVLAVVRAAATLELPVRVSGWLCVADNMPSGRATRPGDVLQILGGTTVEVLNTDAEGRLVLADGLVAASREHPDVIVDVATLTGAILVALGNRHTGVMGDDDTVAAYLAAAARAGEPAWALPLPAYMEDDLDSPIADMRNAKMGDRAGGSLFAGLFLQRFVGRVSDAPDAARIPWVHLDIAGSAEAASAFGAADKGATAATVRSLLEFARAGGR